MKILISPYEVVLEEIEKGRIDPYDVDLEYLIGLFRERAKELSSAECLMEAGAFLSAGAKLLKLKAEVFFPSEKKRKVSIKEVKEVLIEGEGTDYDLSWLYDYRVPVGRRVGVKDKVKRLSWKEFWEQEENVLHKEINYSDLAKKVREEILKGTFRIRTIRDFIAYLYAFLEYEDVPIIKA